MLRHIVIVAVQAIAPVIIIYFAAAGWMIHEHGWAYADSTAFHGVMDENLKYAVTAAILLLLVIVCYRVTRRTLDS